MRAAGVVGGRERSRKEEEKDRIPPRFALAIRGSSQRRAGETFPLIRLFPRFTRFVFLSVAIRLSQFESDSRKRCTRRPCRLFRETAHVRAIYGASPGIGLGAFDRTEKRASGITSEPEKYRDTRARTQRAWQEMTRNVIQMNTA